ncbi:hypothetical protein GCM10029964_115720 [Kibdelosporangium lantanae]
MLAEDFGYQLSPRLAVKMTPEIRKMVDKALEDAANAAGDGAEGTGCAVFVVFVLGMVIALQAKEPWIFIVGIVAAVVIVGVVSLLLSRSGPRPDRKPPKRGCER